MPTLANPRHERFAQVLAAGESADAAYSQAGYRPNRGNAATLKANQSIIDRVAELQAAGAKQAEFSVERVVKELHQTYLDAKAANQHGPAVRALELIGRTLGAFVDKVALSSHDRISDDALIKQLAGDDAEAAITLRKLLGKSDFDPPSSGDTAKPDAQHC